MFRQAVLRLGEFLRALEQRLGRDAADIQAGAAQGLPLLRHRDAHAELGAADGADIAAGTGADDDHVVAVGFGHGSLPGLIAGISGYRRRGAVFAQMAIG